MMSSLSSFLALPIQTSIFGLYGAATCIGPFLGNYLGHYTIANERDVGTIESISATANIFLRLAIGYVADRYRLHRLVYLLCTLVYLVATTSLIGPIFLSTHKTNHRQSVDSAVTRSTTLPQVTSNLSLESDLPTPSTTAEEETHAGQTIPDSSTEALQWFYMVAGLAIISGVASRVNMNLADAFCANIALKTDSSYSAIRFWGAVGRSVCAITLIFVNQLEPFLFPALLIASTLTTLNVLVVAFWPYDDSFDMSDEICLTNDLQTDHENPMRIQFASKKHFKKRKIKGCFSDLQLLDLAELPNESKFKSPIGIINISSTSRFDDCDEQLFENIRRCSVAPIEDSPFYIKHIEFSNNITRIELVSRKQTQESPTKTFEVSKFGSLEGWPEPPPALLDYDKSLEESEPGGGGGGGKDEDEAVDGEEENFGFAIYLRVIVMIGMKDKQLLRFMLLYIANGIIAAPNWVFLFRYLDSIDAVKFARLSAYVLVSRYISETIFYYFSPKSLFKSISHSTSLSIILFIYGLRYSSYPLLGSTLMPLETIVLIETLRAFNMGWYNCVTNEAALKFAAQSNKCVPELIASGQLENNQRTIERLNSGFKATMVVISACCFDGLGFAIGSYISGLISQRYDFRVLWLVTGGSAVFVSLLNLLLEPLMNSCRKKSKDIGDGAGDEPPSVGKGSYVS